MTKNDPFIQEMPLWLEQQQLRLKICERAIADNLEGIAFNKQLIKLEQRRRKIIQQSIKLGKKELAEHREINNDGAEKAS